MFTKLRNKFLILNMSITSTVMIAAFVIIYLITYSNIQAEIQKKLNSQSGIRTITEGTGQPEEKGKEGAKSTTLYFSGDDPLSFTIEVDQNGKILEINSFLEMPSEAYNQAAQTAWNNKQSKSTITIEGRQWRYAISQMRTDVMTGSGQHYTVTENSYQINFLDVTASDKTLFELLTTLLFVGFIMLFVIFVISRYFANRAIKPIAEAWEKQKQFIADASHELKTPLSIINANYDVLLEYQEETIRSQLKWLGYIKIGTDRMTKLINDLLSLAKMDDVRLETKKVPLNMSDVVLDVISLLEAVVLEKGIRLSHAIEPDIIVNDDPEKIKQVVTILFDNAIKYSNENGWIEISLVNSKRQVTFSIKNSGKGIPKQDLPKVFDRFYRADPSRTYENDGYGLGLSIAKTIIDRLGGEIQVASVENESTTFSFTLGL